MPAAGKLTSDPWLMLWPLVDHQPLVVKRESVMLSSPTFCLSLHILQITHPHQSSLPMACQCWALASGSDILLLLGRIYCWVDLVKIFPETTILTVSYSYWATIKYLNDDLIVTSYLQVLKVQVLETSIFSFVLRHFTLRTLSALYMQIFPHLKISVEIIVKPRWLKVSAWMSLTVVMITAANQYISLVRWKRYCPSANVFIPTCRKQCIYVCTIQKTCTDWFRWCGSNYQKSKALTC